MIQVKSKSSKPLIGTWIISVVLFLTGANGWSRMMVGNFSGAPRPGCVQRLHLEVCVLRCLPQPHLGCKAKKGEITQSFYFLEK